MSKIELCNGTMREIENITKENYPELAKIGFIGFVSGWKPTGIKRRKLKCPKCGRKILSSIHIDEDLSFIIHYIPPHKPKGWYRQKNRPKKKSKRNKKNK